MVWSPGTALPCIWSKDLLPVVNLVDDEVRNLHDSALHQGARQDEVADLGAEHTNERVLAIAHTRLVARFGIRRVIL